MKQIVQNYKSGELGLLDVPVPMCKPGGVLVRTRYSLISTGTEMMKVGEASLSMLGKARARPDQVAKVLQSASTVGVTATYRKVMNRLDSYTPLGYSLCGIVEQVGEGIHDVGVGDLVACAGNEHALHAELNWVPRNLYVPVRPGVNQQHAAFSTVGSIAMQGVRQGEPTLGEVALVIGLGLVGQLVVQLLLVSGVRVVGVDPDPARCALAERLGAKHASHPDSETVTAAVTELTSGHGVDQVYLAAGGRTNDPVELAARLARDRGRVVDIGKCRLDLPWNSYYAKELDVRFSRSYGPGRYDPSYELDGVDYPIGYVRWTQRRNLACFLDLLAARAVDVEPLISHVADFDDAVPTYERLKSGELSAVAVLFRYPDAVLPETPASEPASTRPISPLQPIAAARPKPADRPLRLGFIGAGNYASSMLLPHLAGREDVELRHVITTSALSGANAMHKFGFATAGSDADALLDDDIDAIFVVTRHSSHAKLTRQALLAGKAVFVEKPLALNEDELALVLAAIDESGNNRLQVGFNRRFAPLLVAAKQRFGRRVGTASARYLVNAGQLEPGSWYSRAHSEGSRFVGEGGHFVDTLSWLLDGTPSSVFATAAPDQQDLQVMLSYLDGSRAVISYVSSGAPSFGKETLDMFADGKVLHLDDFARAAVHGHKVWRSPRWALGRDKGQRAQLDAFLGAVRSGDPMPVPIESLIATTRATHAVHASIVSGTPVPIPIPEAQSLGASQGSEERTWAASRPSDSEAQLGTSS